VKKGVHLHFAVRILPTHTNTDKGEGAGRNAEH